MFNSFIKQAVVLLFLWNDMNILVRCHPPYATGIKESRKHGK